MNKYAVIVAGGKGERMGTDTPKQFLELKEKPLLYYTVKAFLSAYADLHVILVLPEAHIDKGRSIVADLTAENRVRITAGGETRFHSVKNGLRHVVHPSIVFVHDGVRCLISSRLIHNCYEQAVRVGSAIPVVSATDSIRIQNSDTDHHTIDRDKVKIVQTPQTFKSEMLVKAFEQKYNNSFTDEATVVEASGEKVFLIDGEYKNIKITRPIDLYMAEKLIEIISLAV